MRSSSRRRNFAIALAGATLSAAMAPSAFAAGPATRLVSCGQDACLQISGHRASRSSEVSINGHRVAVEGGRSWRLRLPLKTVREWSVPLARSVDVVLHDPRTGAGSTIAADLPIGLLGHATDLAVLEVRSP